MRVAETFICPILLSNATASKGFRNQSDDILDSVCFKKDQPVEKKIVDRKVDWQWRQQLCNSAIGVQNSDHSVKEFPFLPSQPFNLHHSWRQLKGIERTASNGLYFGITMGGGGMVTIRFRGWAHSWGPSLWWPLHCGTPYPMTLAWLHHDWHFTVWWRQSYSDKLLIDTSHSLDSWFWDLLSGF